MPIPWIMKRLRHDDEMRFLKQRLVRCPESGWIRHTRDLLRMSQADLAHLVGVNQKTVHLWEIKELRREIQMDTMKKVADALDCDFYYAFIPRESLQKYYEKQAFKAALAKEVALINRSSREIPDNLISSNLIQGRAKGLMGSDAVKWKIESS